MTAKRKACARLETNARQKLGQSKDPTSILSDYEKGTCWAAWLLVGMFAFMAFGAVVFGW